MVFKIRMADRDESSFIFVSMFNVVLDCVLGWVSLILGHLILGRKSVVYEAADKVNSSPQTVGIRPTQLGSSYG